MPDHATPLAPPPPPASDAEAVADGATPRPGGRRLYRSHDRMLGGVCGGLAEYLDIDPAVVRLLFVASLLLPGPQVLAYLVAWLVIPPRPVR